MRSRFLFIVGLAACAGHAAQTAPAPNRSVRILGADDPQLPSLAVAAAQTFDRSGNTTPAFQGVILEGVQVPAATDSVIREAQLSLFSDRPVQYGVAPRGEHTLGPSTQKVYALTFFRMTPDSAYVAASTPFAAGNPPPSCITLAKFGKTWRAVSTKTVARPERCGQ
jgi:hypothetical protein